MLVDLLSLVVLRSPDEYRANFCLGDWRTLGVVPNGVGDRSWVWGVSQPPENEHLWGFCSFSFLATQRIAQNLHGFAESFPSLNTVILAKEPLITVAVKRHL